METLSFGAIQEAVRQNGRLTSYAVLHALFSSTEKTTSPVNDLVEAYIPFVSHACKEQSGNQIDLERLQSKIRMDFGIDIPIYTIEFLLPYLQNAGVLQYKNNVKAYFVKNTDDIISIDRNIIEDMDIVHRRFSVIATQLGVESALFSASWSEALVSFLKNETIGSAKKVRDVLITQPSDIEYYAVADIVRTLYEHGDPVYQSVVNVFVGVLIEQFAQNMSSLGGISELPKLTVYLDTSIILRLLGLSGPLFKTASTEMLRYIGDLNAKVEFFSNNEQEVENIISTIISQKDLGNAIYGETGDALVRREISVSDIRALEHVFVEKLAEAGVFPAGYEISGFQRNVKSQIDEGKFEVELQDEARRRLRSYSRENAKSDAISLGHVTRMRRGRMARDISEVPGVFITNNRLLAEVSRRFLVDEGQLRRFEIPPVLHVSQACTIFWLAKDQDISSANASVELISNCYDALGPDSNFYRSLFDKIEEYKDIGDLSAPVTAALRRVAKRQAFGNTAILAKLSAEELLAAAEEDAQNQEKARAEAENNRVKQAERDAKNTERASAKERHRKRSKKYARRIISIPYFIIVVILILSVFYDMISSNTSFIANNIFTSVAIGFVTVLSILDYFNVFNIIHIFERMEDSLANKIYISLYEDRE